MPPAIDLKGRKIGRWTVIERAENTKIGGYQWLCECECGTRRVVASGRLMYGDSQSCGCLARERSRNRKNTPVKNLTGMRFGKLLVIKRDKNDERGHCTWLCKCDCGNEKVIPGRYLIRGKTSCGCFEKDDATIPEGMSKHSLYIRWKGMRYRCQNPDAKDYPRYGGRGITVCDEWDKNFMSFYHWSLENGYDPELQLDRRDNDAGYSPENCRWVTRLENMRNRRPYTTRRDKSATT